MKFKDGLEVTLNVVFPEVLNALTLNRAIGLFAFTVMVEIEPLQVASFSPQIRTDALPDSEMVFEFDVSALSRPIESK